MIPLERAILGLAALFVGILPLRAQAGGKPPAHSGSGPAVSASWRSILAVPAGQRLVGLAIDQRGAGRSKWAYTADITTGRIIKFGTGGKRIGSWIYGKPSKSLEPIGLAIGGSGNLFVADPDAGTVSKFSPRGRSLASWKGFAVPVGVAVDLSGDVFVAEQDAKRVTELSPSGAVIARWTPGDIYPPGGASSPTGVVIGPPNEIYIATACVVGVTCGPGVPAGAAVSGQIEEGLLELFVGGKERGHLLEMWFGLPHGGGAHTQPPDKESEPFAVIGAVAGDRHGWLYVAGEVWWRGATPHMGVLAYTPYGFKWDTLYLPTSVMPTGVAADGRGAAYVAQGNRILTHLLGKRPKSPTG
ncbi:MAG: NHL repeat-containing protein [Chloroflexota bacterium]